VDVAEVAEDEDEGLKVGLSLRSVLLPPPFEGCRPRCCFWCSAANSPPFEPGDGVNGDGSVEGGPGGTRLIVAAGPV